MHKCIFQRNYREYLMWESFRCKASHVEAGQDKKQACSQLLLQVLIDCIVLQVPECGREATPVCVLGTVDD